jgi:hypothetical protein
VGAIALAFWRLVRTDFVHGFAAYHSGGAASYAA